MSNTPIRRPYTFICTVDFTPAPGNIARFGTPSEVINLTRDPRSRVRQIRQHIPIHINGESDRLLRRPNGYDYAYRVFLRVRDRETRVVRLVPAEGSHFDNSDDILELNIRLDELVPTTIENN